MVEIDYAEMISKLAKTYPVEFPSIVTACSNYVRSIAQASAKHTVIFEKERDLEKALSAIPEVREVGVDAFATGLVKAMFEARKQ